jgi:hypothetical protein
MNYYDNVSGFEPKLPLKSVESGQNEKYSFIEFDSRCLFG